MAPLNLAKCLELAGQVEQALELLGSLIARNPADTSALGRLVFLLHDRGQGAEAMASSLRTRELAPQDPRAHNCLGVSCALQHRNEEAIVAYRAALALAPNSGDSWNNLGAALHEVRRLRRGHERLSRSLAHQ